MSGPTEIQVRCAELHEQIKRENYFTDLYFAVLEVMYVTETMIQKHTLSDAKLVVMMDAFWETLPDSMSIRRGPFFGICDIAENIYDITPEDLK